MFFSVRMVQEILLGHDLPFQFRRVEGAVLRGELLLHCSGNLGSLHDSLVGRLGLAVSSPDVPADPFLGDEGDDRLEEILVPPQLMPVQALEDLVFFPRIVPVVPDDFSDVGAVLLLDKTVVVLGIGT